MPSRFLVLIIVTFWVATTGWLFHRDIWPRIRPGEPPPFSIDLADEANQKGPHKRWLIERGGKRIGTCESWIEYQSKDDSFEIHSLAKNLELFRVVLTITATRMNGTYRVSRDGELKGIYSSALLTISGMDQHVYLSVKGKVENDIFAPVAAGGLVSKSEANAVPRDDQLQIFELEPVPVSKRASVIDPLQPINRITGLRRGRHWRVSLVSPLQQSLAATAQKNPALQLLLQKTPGEQVLLAEVLPQTRSLEWGGKVQECLVIEYRGDQMTAHTWVREADGLVLRQDATLWGEELILTRE